MSAVLVAAMIVLLLLFGLGIVVAMTKMMRAEADKVRAARATGTRGR